MVGSFPPPVHGAALVNVRIREGLDERGIPVWVIDQSPESLARSTAYFLRRLAKVARGLGLLTGLVLRRRLGTLYLAVSGGYGQVYELVFVVLARLARLRIVIHHHSYAYLRRRAVITRVLFVAAGKRAGHVALCDDMEQRLRKLYPSVTCVHVLSNAAMLPPAATRSPRSELNRVAFLGNVSFDKGIEEFFGAMIGIRERYPEVIGLIAGPFMNRHVEAAVLARVHDGSGVLYVGPQYGKAKEAFFDGIDALLFPSSYRHEADPLTVYEAMRQGVPVICTNRGCLASVVASDCGLVVDQLDGFVPAAVAQLGRWRENPTEFARASRRSLERAASLARRAEAGRESLLTMLADAAS